MSQNQSQNTFIDPSYTDVLPSALTSIYRTLRSLHFNSRQKVLLETPERRNLFPFTK